MNHTENSPKILPSRFATNHTENSREANAYLKSKVEAYDVETGPANPGFDERLVHLQITHEKKGKWSEPNFHDSVSSR